MSPDDPVSPDEPVRPELRVVRGDAGPEEIAALVAVLAAAGGPGVPEPAPERSGWAAREALVRAPARPGPGAWRASGRPR